jgi:hypothetical protein
MIVQTEDNLKESENFLSYIPYNKLVDLDNKEYLEAFIKYVSNKHSLLPEMAGILSPEQLLNFLFIFSGQLLSIPDQKTILATFKDLDIFFSLTTNPTSSEIQRLASKYQTTIQTVKVTADKVAEALQKDSPIK